MFPLIFKQFCKQLMKQYNNFYQLMKTTEDNGQQAPSDGLQGTNNLSLIQSQPAQQQNKQQNEKISCGLYLLFSYLYFIQGFMIGMIKTVPYMYVELPNIDIMIIFSSVSIPSSLKFIIGPFLQKFTLTSYGKRKTWIIMAEVSISILLFVGAFFTELQNAKTLAILCFLIQFFMIFTNIALHALIVKEIKCSHQSSWIHSFAELLGILLGSLTLLKLTSKEFAQSIGLQHQITTPQVVLTCMAVLIMIPTLLIHFRFKERILESQLRSKQLSFWKILKTFKVFLQLKTKYFRYCVFIFLYLQGLNFFTSLYDYELISSGFSKDTSNTINNLVIFPILFLTFAFRKVENVLKGTRNAIMLSTSLTVSLSLYICIVFPTDVVSISILVFLLTLLDSWRFYSFSVITNDFPVHALTGMYLTVFASAFNFGKFTFFHALLCKYFGWKIMAIIGLILQALIVLLTPKFYGWVLNGNFRLPKQIQQDKISSEIQTQAGSHEDLTLKHPQEEP